MNLELILESVSVNPLLYIGLSGGAAMVCYLTVQLLAVASRQRFENKANNLQLAALKKQIEILEQKAKAAPDVGWNGLRKFVVWKKVSECLDGSTYSFYLKPHNGKPLPPFKPGQYLGFQFKLPGQPKPTRRFYSISDGYTTDQYYRVTIKRAMPHESSRWEYDPKRVGLVSGHFSDVIQEGDIIDVDAPNGHFFLNVEIEKPVVLLSAGVGITPMHAMARYLTHIGDQRKIYYFFSCRSSADHMLREEVVEMQKKNPNIEVYFCYSKPLETDVLGKTYHHKGRITIDLLKAVLPSSNFLYFLCGPNAFMEGITNELCEWGVPRKDVDYEAFGPPEPAAAPPKSADAAQSGATITVEYAKSGKIVPWEGGPNLCQNVEKNAPEVQWQCYVGSCGACETKLNSGEVEYDKPPGWAYEEGFCLPCVGKPKGNIVLDA